MRRGIVITGLIIVGVVIVGVATGPFMSRIEQPPYEVVRSDGSIEVRSYPAMTVAATTVRGSRASAASQGFQILAGYIFGGNDGGRKIEMTAPVMQERSSTAVGEPRDETGDWTVRFVMPRALSRDRLPEPRDHRVTLDTMPPARFAAIRFSGFWRDGSLQQKTSELESWLARNGLAAKSGPVFAFYNPPWTLPFFRRNEVLIEVASSPG